MPDELRHRLRQDQPFDVALEIAPFLRPQLARLLQPLIQPRSNVNVRALLAGSSILTMRALSASPACSTTYSEYAAPRARAHSNWVRESPTGRFLRLPVIAFTSTQRAGWWSSFSSNKS